MKAKTVSAIGNRLFFLSVCCGLLTRALCGALQLECLERDWFTLLSRDAHDVTSLELAVAEQAPDLHRLLIAFTYSGEGPEEANSELAYIDYLTCETLFYIRNPQAYQAGLFSTAISLGAIGESETLFQVGKLAESSKVLVTRVRDEDVLTYGFDFTTLDNYSSQ